MKTEAVVVCNYISFIRDAVHSECNVVCVCGVSAAVTQLPYR